MVLLEQNSSLSVEGDMPLGRAGCESATELCPSNISSGSRGKGLATYTHRSVSMRRGRATQNQPTCAKWQNGKTQISYPSAIFHGLDQQKKVAHVLCVN